MVGRELIRECSRKRASLLGLAAAGVRAASGGNRRRSGAFAGAVSFVLFAVGGSGVFAQQTDVVRLSSASTGGGTLAVEVTWPDNAAEDRYDDGAPIVVPMQGGVGSGSFQNYGFLVDQGFVVVQFLYPGGSDGAESSDGIYDYRGPNCILAARDVWLFALGRSTTSDGRTIHDVVGRTVRTDLMAVTAHSNGGNITPAVLDLYSDDLQGIRMLSVWETAGSSQVATSEAGRTNYDCDPDFDADANGEPEDEGINPRYDPLSGYAYAEQAIDYSQLAWDTSLTQWISDAAGTYPPAARNGVLFLDGNGNGRYDHRPGERMCPDVDMNGLVDPYEDFLFSNRATWLGPGQPRVHYSEPVTRYLEQNPEIFGGAWPEWVADAAEAEQFWEHRAGNKHLHLLDEYRNDLSVIVSFSRVAHAHTLRDIDDARMQIDGFSASGLWHRMNPDRAYFLQANGNVPGGYPDNPARIRVPAGEMPGHAVQGRNGRNTMIAPALMELADRTYHGGWVDQLDEILVADGIPLDEVTGLVWSDSQNLSWQPAAGVLFYDVIRGDTRSLTASNDQIDLGTVTCVEEDSQDSQSVDSETPISGRAWFYLVRPNGLSGHYGAGQNDRRRRPSRGDCRH